MTQPPRTSSASVDFAQPLRIATRESRLALWQAEHVRTLLAAQGGAMPELLGMTTQGDRILDRALSQIGGKGLFVKELEAAIAERRADLAVHSLKDVPMHLPAGFELAAVLVREDPRDAWVSPQHAHWRELPQGARVGTSSLRRVAQIRADRPDLRLESLRGNLDTRLRKLDEGAYDGIVLAAAGLVRLGLESRIRVRVPTRDMLPAAGQGALGIEIRSDDTALRARLQPLVDVDTWIAVHAEREVSRQLGGSCSVPLAAHATWDGPTLVLEACLGDARAQGDAAPRPLLRAQARAPIADAAQRAGALQDAALRRQWTHTAEALGVQVAQQLRDQGGADYLPAA